MKRNHSIQTRLVKTMTSLEVAELTRKSHAHILRDIRTMIKQLESAKAENPTLVWHCIPSTYIDSQGKQRKSFRLDKDTTLTLLSGYDIVARHKIIVRWSQLEKERAEEEANPELAVKRGNARAERNWAAKGMSPEWIDRRIMSITARKGFARVLAAHGVHHNGFRNCTNAIYTPMYGGSSEVVRAKKQLKPSDNIRDNMSMVELGTILLAESLAAEAIEQQQAQGNGECELICGKTAKVIAQSVITARKTAKTTIEP